MGEDLFCLEYFAGVASVTAGFRLLAQSMLHLQIVVGRNLLNYYFLIVVVERNFCSNLHALL